MVYQNCGEKKPQNIFDLIEKSCDI